MSIGTKSVTSWKINYKINNNYILIIFTSIIKTGNVTFDINDPIFVTTVSLKKRIIIAKITYSVSNWYKKYKELKKVISVKKSPKTARYLDSGER